MRVTRQHFKLIADAVNLTTRRYGWERSYTVQIAEELTDALRSTNPHFDGDRFLRACYGEK